MNATIQGQANYRSKYGNYNYRIDIVDSQEAAENIRAYDITPEGVVLSYETDQENLLQTIISSTATFTLVCTTQAQVDFIRTIAQETTGGRYGIALKYANDASTPITTTYVGVILSNELSFNDSLPQQITIKATDDLGYLNDAPYLQNDGTRYTGEATVREHFFNALSKLRTHWYWSYFLNIFGTDFYNIYISLGKNLIPSTYSSESAAYDLFDETKLTHLAFYDNEDTQGVKSCYYVLDHILKHFNSTLYQGIQNGTAILNVLPLGAFLKYAEDGTQLTGYKYRTNGVVYQTNPTTFVTNSLDNTATNKYRLSGGRFSYTLPYKTVTRQLKWNGTQWLFQNVLNTHSDFFTTINHPVQAFSSGDQLRVVAPFYFQITGVPTAETLFNAVTGSTAEAPLNYHIGRIRVKIQMQFVIDGANDIYVKRALTAGDNVPIFETFGDTPAASLPINYTDLTPQDEVTLVADGSAYAYEQISEPYDITLNQTVSVPVDFIVPALTANTDSVKIYVSIEQILPTGAVATHTDGTNYITLVTNPYASYRVFPFNGFDLDSGQVYTATNAGDFRKTLDIGTSTIHDNGQSSNFGALKYRQGNGTYAFETTGYTSSIQSSNTMPAAKLCVQEAAHVYGKARFTYEGNLIDGFASSVTTRFSFKILYTITDGSTLYKLKAISIEFKTGLQEASVILMEVGTLASDPPTDFEDDFTPPPMPPPPSPDSIVRMLSTNTTLSQAAAPSIEALDDVIGFDRSSQTGNKLLVVDANGIVQEVADGSANQTIKTNGSGGISWATLTSGSDGWHGSTALLKVMPSEFIMNDDYNRAPTMVEDDTADILGIKAPATTSELYAFIAIPTAFKATHVQVYASASTSSAVTVLSFNQTSGATVSKGTGDFNSAIDITDITSSTTANVVIKIAPNSNTTVIYGADVTITAV